MNLLLNENFSRLARVRLMALSPNKIPKILILVTFLNLIVFRVHPLRLREHPLDPVGGHPHRPRELCRQQPQHPEEGALQEEDVPQGRPLLDGRVN